MTREEIQEHIKGIRYMLDIQDQPGGNARIVRNLRAELDVWNNLLYRFDHAESESGK